LKKLMPQHPLQAGVVSMQLRLPAAFGDWKKAAVLLGAFAL
jgi:hypothetical protein